MTARSVPLRPAPSLRLREEADPLLDLPWELPLAMWPSDLPFVEIPVGESRHLVRFLALGGVTYAVKEEPLAHEKLCPVLGVVRVPSAAPSHGSSSRTGTTSHCSNAIPATSTSMPSPPRTGASATRVSSHFWSPSSWRSSTS